MVATTAQNPTLLQSVLWKNRDPEAPGQQLRPKLQQNAFYRNKDKAGLDWLVFLIAASGFFTDSYNLFASNVILPAVAYVYWRQEINPAGVLGFQLATLAASAVGQLFFGCFADLYGRRSLYGVELIIVIISTVGLLQCSVGHQEDGQITWTITPWIIFWRTIMGLGIGAEYPLSACIAAEWSSTKTRGRMMSAVFLMQPLGQLSAYGAGLTALKVFGSTPIGIDKLWRYVVGVGAIPTLLALIFRIAMPETGYYTYDVRRNENRASVDVSTIPSKDAPVPPGPDIPRPNLPESEPNQFHFTALRKYLIDDGNWIFLAGTSITWFLLDFAFYGIGFNSPATLTKIWAPQDISFSSDTPWWLKTSDATLPETSNNGTYPDWVIGHVLKNNMHEAIYTVSIASIVGSIAMIAFINRFERRKFLTVSFFCLGIGLIVIAASFHSLFHQDAHYVLIFFWVLVSFGFSFGPNTLTFIIPAEIFPTRYRCTFYGIAAASGKLGALLVQIILFEDHELSKPNDTNIRWLFLGFGFCMLLGAVTSHFMLPMVQRESGVARPPWENIPLRLMEEEAPKTLNALRIPRRRRKKKREESVDQADDGFGNGSV